MERRAASPLAHAEWRVAGLEHAPAIPATAHLTLVTTSAGLLGLETGWRRLEQSYAGKLTVFQTFDWVSAWCRIYASDAGGAQIHVLAGYDENRLVFVWPLMLKHKQGMKILCWLTEPFGQYGDVICDESESPRLWVANALRFIRRLKDIDILRLRHVRDDSTLAKVAAGELVNANLNERAPYLDLTRFATEADYENRYTGTQRKRRKKIRKHLEEFGEISFHRLPLGSLSDKAISAAIAEKNKWLSERGRINKILGCPGHADFLKCLARAPQQDMQMVVTEMRAGERAVSWEISFRFKGTHFAYITSHVNALTDLSPGRLHFDYSQRACIADGLTAFDLMVPYDAHKESWSSDCMPTQDYYVPLSLKGRVAGAIYLKRLRPMLRSLYYRTPQSVLKWINPWRGHSAD